MDLPAMKAIWFGSHLYQPLLYVKDRVADIFPVALNKGERQFVEDLKAFHENDGGFFEGKKLYVLRNLSKGRGIGFFEGGNFHPDFILWLIVGGVQHVIFVDPKGLLHVGEGDPKIRFCETVKEIEARLAEPDIRLHAFIVSNTPSFAMAARWGMTKPAMIERHVLFQEEDRETYVRSMLGAVLA